MPDVFTFCVVAHSRGVEHGYVVRTAYNGWLPQPYTDAERLREYPDRERAQRHADHANLVATMRASPNA